jgi:hypothetical protein
MSTATATRPTTVTVQATEVKLAIDPKTSSKPKAAKPTDKSKTTTLALISSPIPVEVIETESIAIPTGIPAIPTTVPNKDLEISNIVEIKPNVMIVRPTQESIAADKNTDKIIAAGLKSIAEKAAKAKTEKTARPKGWTLPGGVIEPKQSIAVCDDGSIMAIIVDLLVKGSTQAEFEAAGIGKGGNPFTYINQKKGHGVKREGDRFFLLLPDGVALPPHHKPDLEAKAAAAKAKAKAKADAEALKAAKAAAKAEKTAKAVEPTDKPKATAKTAK